MAKLPEPPERTAFKQDKDGGYHHTVMLADLRLSGKNATIVTNGSPAQEISGKSPKTPEKAD